MMFRYFTLIEADEGNRLTVYDDATGHPVVPGYKLVGHPTIGTGRALDVHGISEAERHQMLQNDVSDAEQFVRRTFRSVPLTDDQLYVFINMTLNVGQVGFLKFRKMIAAVNQQDWLGAANEMWDSDAARGAKNRYRRLCVLLYPHWGEPVA